jgi:hypothetical protein
MANFNPEEMMEMFLRNPAMMQAREAKKVKCPTCNTPHAYCPAPPGTPRMQDRYSHNARAIFCSGSCPICLEDNIDPPMVAFACGHLVCVNDFKRLGGRVGAEAMKTAVEVLEEEREEARRDLQNAGGGEEIDMETLQRLAMFGGMAGMGGGPPGADGGIPPFVQAASEIFGPDMARNMFAGGMPNGGGFFQGFFPGHMGDEHDMRDEGDYDVDEIYEEDYDEDEDEDSDDDDDLPALLNRDGTTAAEPTAAAQARTAPAAPPASRTPTASIAADAAAARATTRAATRATTRAATRAAAAADEDDDDDELLDDLPPLEPRNAHAHDSDSDDDSDGSVPDLLVRSRADDSSNSSSSSEEEEEAPAPAGLLPAVIERVRNAAARNSQPDDSDDSDGDSLPALVPRTSSPTPNTARGGAPSAAAPAATDSDSDDDMPTLMGGHLDRNSDDSDQDSDDDDIPELLCREMDRDSDDSDDDSVPNGAGAAADADGDESDDDSMPGLTGGAGGAPAPAAAAAAPAPAAVASRPRADLLKEKTEEAKKMKVKDLKKELKKLGIPTNSMVEKVDLVNAYVEAVVPRGDDDIEEVVEVVDIFANLPGLVSAKDPPQNGTWILAPSETDTNKRELQYVFVDESKVKTVPFGDFAEGACLIPALDGAVWVYTPAANSSLETWEIHRVDPIFRMKLFDVEKQAQIVCDGHYGHWALNSSDKSNPRSERKLVFVANKFSHDGNTIRDNVPSGSSIFPDRSGGVWLHVPRESNATTTQSGLWHCTPNESTHIMSDYDDSAQIICDGDRRGLMILSPSEGGMSTLFHVHEGGDREERVFDIDFSDVQAIVDDGKDGVFAHCRRNDRWKLCHTTTSSHAIEGVYDCPKNSKICSDTMGGVWVWKKVGKAGGRCLAHVDDSGNTHERDERFPVGSVMAGM